MGFVAEFGKRAFDLAGLRVRRKGHENRFDAMGDALTHLRNRGFRPDVVIDGGSNVGQWAGLAMGIFPGAHFHLIEPQPACWPLLEASLPASRVTLHKTVVTSPGVAEIRMISLAADGHSTGAFVETPAEPADVPRVTYPASTLDALVAPRLAPGDRLLLKLDLEGHEIQALNGATALLPRIDVIVSEVSFFDIYHHGHATFSALLAFLDAREFELYDIAALAARRRDDRLRMGDVVFARRGTPLLADVSWD